MAQPPVADGQGPADWSDGEDDINEDDIMMMMMIDINDADEGRVHHMFSRILKLRFFFTKFGKSFLKSVNSNFTLAVHSPKLNQAKTEISSPKIKI